MSQIEFLDEQSDSIAGERETYYHGILPAIAIPKFQNTRGNTGASTMRSRRNLVVAEEAMFYDSAKYSTDTAALKFRPSSGVTIAIMLPGAGSGWAATATNPLAHSKHCTVFFESFTSVPAAAQEEGVAACQ